MGGLLRKLFGRSPKHHCFVLLAQEDSPPVWTSEHWGDVVLALDPVIASIDARAHVAVNARPARGERSDKCRFGRLSWASPERWTVDPTSPAHDVIGITVVTPSLAIAEKTQTTPAFFMHVLNDVALGIEDPKIPYRLVLAVRDDVCDPLVLDTAVDALTELIGPQMVLQKARPWSYRFGDSEHDTLPISDYAVVMPAYEERNDRPIGEPRHGWTVR